MYSPENAVACYPTRRYHGQQVLFILQVDRDFCLYVTYPFVTSWPLRTTIEGALLDAVMLCSPYINGTKPI